MAGCIRGKRSFLVLAQRKVSTFGLFIKNLYSSPEIGTGEKRRGWIFGKV